MVFSPWLLAGFAAGAGAASAVLLPRLRGVTAALAAARAAAGSNAAERVAAAAALSALRHDLRGILSPAMLTADRLLLSPDAATKRAGEVVLRTVERATARLAETRDQAGEPAPRASSDQG